MKRRNQFAFTLIELIVVITISGIIAAVVARNISRPIQGFVDTTRRAALVDAGDTAMGRLIRETRLALPNSVRLEDGGRTLEFLRTRTGGRYRAQADPRPGEMSDILDFTINDTQFDVLGTLKSFGQICAATPANCGGGAATTAACRQANASIDCLVVYNTGQPADCTAAVTVRSNAYCGDNMAGVEDTNVPPGTITFVNSAGAFPLPSPNQRFHIVDTPVSYVCDLAQNQLIRYEDYGINATQPTRAVLAGAAGQVLADKLVGCAFTYDPGSATRAALLTVRLVLADDDAPNERVTLFQQAHVANVP